MPASVLVVHLLLSILLFFLMNWVGRHSVLSDSYYQITYFSRNDEAPAFNLFFRIIAPVVYLVLVSACLYLAELEAFVDQIYLVVVYQQVLRWAYIVIMGRGRLVRWLIQVNTAAITFTIAWLAYQEILISPTRLLPDLDDISSELWLVVILFMYKMVDRVYTPTEGNAKKKELYLTSRFKALRRRYGPVVDTAVGTPDVEPLVYAVMIYESFNRPRSIQTLEHAVGVWRGNGSYGPMQVQSPVPISDSDSVVAGGRRLEQAYLDRFALLSREYEGDLPDNSWRTYIKREATRRAAATYNVRSDYADEVMSIWEFLIERFYDRADRSSTAAA